MSNYFVRYCKLSFLDKNYKDIYEIQCGGLPNQARIAFEISRDIEISHTIAEIKVFNLSDETAQQVRGSVYVKLEAGYEGNCGLIFIGDVFQLVTKRFIDKESIFYAIVGKQELQRKITIQLNTLCSLQSVLMEIERIGGIKIENPELFGDFLKSTIYRKGFSLYGSIRDIIKKVADAHNKCFVYEAASDYISKGRIIFFNRDGTIPNNQNVPFTIQSGVNLIAADYSSRERDFREKYFRERVPVGKADIKTIQVSCLFEHKINLRTSIKLIDTDDASGVHAIKTLKYFIVW